MGQNVPTSTTALIVMGQIAAFFKVILIVSDFTVQMTVIVSSRFVVDNLNGKMFAFPKIKGSFQK